MIYRNIITDLERAFYASAGDSFINITTSGEADGESAFKESHNIDLTDCLLTLRYPFWHDTGLRMIRCELLNTCRAALWYTADADIVDCKLHGIKALRECKRVSLVGCDIVSQEFGWRCEDVQFDSCTAEGEYFMFMSRDINVKNLTFSGKYSFQYCDNVTIENSKLATKDAFWHTKNVTVKNSTVSGEYLGWYSENLTLIDCKISGTQPLCYCNGLKLINCTSEDCDLSFENSNVQADIVGDIISVKNPCGGYVRADSIGEIILDEYVRGECDIIIK